VLGNSSAATEFTGIQQPSVDWSRRRALNLRPCQPLAAYPAGCDCCRSCRGDFSRHRPLAFKIDEPAGLRSTSVARPKFYSLGLKLRTNAERLLQRLEQRVGFADAERAGDAQAGE
jgi:hypothetical protein